MSGIEIRRFIDDDTGYVAWLAGHPEGYVLNTYPHVTSAYLVLHRASCRTINRPLAAGRTWTHLYGKSCSDDREVLAKWANRETGKPVQSCGHCLRGGVGAAASPNERSGWTRPIGPRTPRQRTRDVVYEGEPVTVVVAQGPHDAPGAPPLVIEGAQWLAETFFVLDPSAVGPSSYDEWIAASLTDPSARDRIVTGDVHAVNRTMAAHAYHSAWEPIVTAGDVPWLRAIDPTWRLFELSDQEWAQLRVAERLTEAFEAIVRPHLKIAVTTKVLHIKRPELIPVLDSVVMQQIGMRESDDVAVWVRAIDHIRTVGRENLPALRAVRDHLEARGIHGRSLVRILDALLWTASPGAGLFRQLDGWERVVRRHRV